MNKTVTVVVSAALILLFGFGSYYWNETENVENVEKVECCVAESSVVIAQSQSQSVAVAQTADNTQANRFRKKADEDEILSLTKQAYNKALGLSPK